jgi:hypothetical protein
VLRRIPESGANSRSVIPSLPSTHLTRGGESQSFANFLGRSDFFFWVDLKMEIEITPECLSREGLVHELTVRGTVVSDADPVEKLAFNLKVFLSMERDGILFDTGV